MPVVDGLLDAREPFHDLCVETGQQVLKAMMEADPRGAVRREGAPPALV